MDAAASAVLSGDAAGLLKGADGQVEMIRTLRVARYTVALLSAVPDPRPRRRKKRLILKGDIPSPANPPSGCRFHTWCWLRERLENPERCVAETPELRDLGPGHAAACHFAEEVSAETIASAAGTSSV